MELTPFALLEGAVVMVVHTLELDREGEDWRTKPPVVGQDSKIWLLRRDACKIGWVNVPAYS